MTKQAYYAIAQGDALTPREIDVVRALADGLACKAIAKRLQMSPATVADHKKHVFRKLGAQTSAGAVGAAFRARLIE